MTWISAAPASVYLLNNSMLYQSCCSKCNNCLVCRTHYRVYKSEIGSMVQSKREERLSGMWQNVTQQNDINSPAWADLIKLPQRKRWIYWRRSSVKGSTVTFVLSGCPVALPKGWFVRFFNAVLYSFSSHSRMALFGITHIETSRLPVVGCIRPTCTCILGILKAIEHWRFFLACHTYFLLGTPVYKIILYSFLGLGGFIFGLFGN